jgi:hypothetical protein
MLGKAANPTVFVEDEGITFARRFSSHSELQFLVDELDFRML